MEKEYININATQRVIESKPRMLLGILGDKDAERVRFKSDKIVGDYVDLSKLQLYIKYAACDKRAGKYTKETQIYHCEDVQDCGDYITFSWLMSGNVFSESGFVAYSILAANGDEVRWNTYPAVGTVGMTVPGGLEEVAEKYPDVITQLFEQLEEIKTAGIPEESISDAVSKYLSDHPVDVPVKKVNGKTGDVNLTPEDIGAEPSGTVTSHNVSDTAHSDIRVLIANLASQVATFLDVDDATMDQASEFVAYMKANRSLIESVTTSKVSASDIIDNLETNLANKPLSSAQGVKLKGLYDSLKSVVDSIIVPTLLSQLAGDASHRTVSDGEKETWNKKATITYDAENKTLNISSRGVILLRLPVTLTDDGDYELLQNGRTLEFVSDVSECTDTSKLYVLPSGSIYSFMYSEITTNEYTNMLPTAQVFTTGDSSVLDGVGYRDGYYASSSGGVGSATSGYTCTGLIPYALKDTGVFPTIYIKGCEWEEKGSSRIYFYRENKTILSGYINITGANGKFDTYFTKKELGDGYFSLTPTESLNNFANTITAKQIKYFCISLKGSGANLVISLDSSIESTISKDYQWTNTGHAFVPADYKEKIIDLEERTTALESNNGSGTATDISIPDYVQNEAERVANLVTRKQNINTFTFMAISDAHYLANNANIVKSILHAGQGMNLVRKGSRIDFAVNLGDNGWGSGIKDDPNRATIEMGYEEIRATNKCIDDAFRGIPNFRIPGNHCYLTHNYEFNGNEYLDGSRLFPLYGAYNVGAVYPEGEKHRGYCHRDFDDWKLRVIILNTIDIDGEDKDLYMSGTQLKWFAQTLDMSSKVDANEWSILLLSHHPLDFGSPILCCKILKAYTEGGVVSLARDEIEINYDYAGKNAATIIANIHGHNHNLKVDNLRYLVSGSTTEPIGIKRICIPNACFQRANERGTPANTADIYDIDYGEDTTYNKTAGTAKDTAFCVITVDTKQRKVYAHCYGAGYDREVDY